MEVPMMLLQVALQALLVSRHEQKQRGVEEANTEKTSRWFIGTHEAPIWGCSEIDGKTFCSEVVQWRIMKFLLELVQSSEVLNYGNRVCKSLHLV